MDALDFAILREIAWRPDDVTHRARGIRDAWEIARVLDVHGSTVKRRLAAMTRAGVLLGVQLHPASRLLNASSALYRFTFPSTRRKRAALEAFVTEPAVWDVHDFVGPEAWVGVVAPEGWDLGAEAARVAEATDAEFTLHHERGWPLAEERVTDLDWRIMRALVDDATRAAPDVAEDVGVTPKTVRARLAALAERRAFAVVPQVRLARVRGRVAFVLDVAFDPDAGHAARAAVADGFPDAFYRSLPLDGDGYLLLTRERTSDTSDAITLAEDVPGVASARVLLVYASHMEPQKIRDAIDRTRADSPNRARDAREPDGP